MRAWNRMLRKRSRAHLTALCAALLLLPIAPSTNIAHVREPNEASGRVLQLPTAVEEPAASESPNRVVVGRDPETRFLKALVEVRASRIDNALQELELLLRETPNFRLAHLMKGDLLLARARPIDTFGNVSDVGTPELLDLRAEALARINRHLQPIDDGERIPRYLMQMPAAQKYALVVDTRRARLYVFHNDRGQPKRVADYYASSGKNGAAKMREGDQRTPIGVYHVTADLSGRKLGDFYGSGAFALDYPNEWDRRAQRSGSGIWLHGTPPETYSRAPRASNGCVVLANQDLDSVRKYLKAGVTPVIIAEAIEWVDVQAWEQARAELTQQLESWRQDWESLRTSRYLSHYGAEFQSEDGKDLEQWMQHKHATNGGKSWIKVKLYDVSIFTYPSNPDLAVVTFEQDYASSNFESDSRKRQYWQRYDGEWKIVYEGQA